MMRPDDVYQPDLSTLDIQEPAHDSRSAVAAPQTSDLMTDDLLFGGSAFAPEAAPQGPPPAAAYSAGAVHAIDLSSQPTGGGVDLSVPHMGAELEKKEKQREEQEHSFTGQATAVLRDSGIHEYLPTQIQDALAPGPENEPGPDYYTPEAQQRRAAERACEGRWVPTYMRQQLVQNGHTTFPTSAPNAHEFRQGEAPPSLYEALKGMGEEISQILYAALGGIFDLTAQCKRAAHQVTERAVSVGEGVTIEGCDEVCFGVCGSTQMKTDDSDPEAIPPVIPETTPTLGPIRSRLRRELPCTFEALALIAKMRLLTPHAPPELQRLVKRREFMRQTTDHKTASERWHLVVEPGPDASPSAERFPQLQAGASSSQLREIWQVYPKYCRASVEISNEPSWAAKVLVCLKMDVVQLPDGQNCEIDSRLYVLPRDRDPDRQEIDLPSGLIEALIDAHHVQTERVRDFVMAMVAADGPTQSAGGVGVPGVNRLPPVTPAGFRPPADVSARSDVKVEVEPTPYAPAMDLPGQPSHPSQDPPMPLPKVTHHQARRSVSTEGSKDGVDKDLLLKFADGI